VWEGYDPIEWRSLPNLGEISSCRPWQPSLSFRKGSHREDQNQMGEEGPYTTFKGGSATGRRRGKHHPTGTEKKNRVSGKCVAEKSRSETFPRKASLKEKLDAVRRSGFHDASNGP